jgi:hypothetical protein
MRLAAYQPQYFPRLHYINRAMDSDVFVVLDSTQFTRRLKHHGAHGSSTHPSYQAHAPIRLASGEHLLTLPVRHQGTLMAINEARVADDRGEWVRQHLRTIHSGYANAPWYGDRYPEVCDLLERDHDDLATLNESTLLWAVAVLLDLDIPTSELTVDTVNAELKRQDRVRLRRIVQSSQMAAERPEGRQQGNAWIVAMCHEVGADEYLCGGTAAGNYLDEGYFAAHGVRPVLQSWQCPSYCQQFTDRHPFMPNLSVLDLLCNVDPAASLAVIRPE